MHLTRRHTLKSFTVMAATFFTTGLVAPARRSRPVVEGRTTDLAAAEVEAGWTKAASTGAPAEMIAFDWDGPPATIEFRARNRDGWSGWKALTTNLDEGPDLAQPARRRTAGPAWVGYGTEEVQLRLASGRARDVKMRSIATLEETSLFGTALAEAAIARPGIITRAQWGADESYRTDPAAGCSGNPDYADGVRNAFVHHTVNANDYLPSDSAAMVRAIYHYHTHPPNDWCDIGYNFVIDRYGQIFEGRAGGIDQAVIGAHAGGFNTASTGIALLGTFESHTIPADMYSGLVSLLSWKLAHHGVRADGRVTVTSSGSSKYPAGTRVTLPTVAGHRDVSATACPGDVTYSLLGRLRSDVQWAIDSSVPKRLDVFARGPSQDLRHLWYENSWRSWGSLGGTLTSDPGSVSWAPGRIDVFARGASNELSHQWFDGRWHTWESLGGNLTSGPDVSSWSPGRLDVFARGTNDDLIHTWFDGRWHGWESLGGHITSGPSAVSWGPGRIDVFARGAANDLVHTWFDGRWHGWESLGGNLTSGPDVASWAPGRLDVFARDGANRLAHRWFEGRWQAWGSLGGNLASDPSAVSWGPGRIDVFARGPADDLQHLWFEGRWRSWESLGGSLTSGPDVASWN